MEPSGIFFKREKEWSYFGEQYRYSCVFLLEIVDSSDRIKKCHKVAGLVMKITATSVRSGKFPRLRFSAKCHSYH